MIDDWVFGVTDKLCDYAQLDGYLEYVALFLTSSPERLECACFTVK